MTRRRWTCFANNEVCPGSRISLRDVRHGLRALRRAPGFRSGGDPHARPRHWREHRDLLYCQRRAAAPAAVSAARAADVPDHAIAGARVFAVSRFGGGVSGIPAVQPLLRERRSVPHRRGQSHGRRSRAARSFGHRRRAPAEHAASPTGSGAPFYQADETGLASPPPVA